MQEIVEMLKNSKTKAELIQHKLDVRVQLYQMVRRLLIIFYQININNGNDVEMPDGERGSQKHKRSIL